MAMRHRATQEQPVDLPVGFNAWLLDCAPAPSCATCRAEWRSLKAAEEVGEIWEAANHATKVRDHASGSH
ncbi:hypothetical protein JHN61_09775 [Streptomyces sp. MBT67]|nr:hypothetical protein [Streptomyces sp. MBT72]MBK3536500.1 hypothetical protein [Streptomyces sp. MBT67]MBK3549924.1 hypothetical protein [Streptomyces sp. MBT61]MBK6031227.1 hypothetical protein [Streptomyces sp. MBT59]